jgi:MOSC domain-containing protein YiiM
MNGRLLSIQISNGGVPKRPIAFARVTEQGLEGDRQRDLRYHGGPLRAVSLYSAEAIEALRAEGHPIAPGSAGENLTILGLEWARLSLGDRLSFQGGVELELTSLAAPCRKLKHCFLGGAFTRISAEKHPGWSRFYAKVLSPGLLVTGGELKWRSAS